MKSTEPHCACLSWKPQKIHSQFAHKGLLRSTWAWKWLVGGLANETLRGNNFLLSVSSGNVPLPPSRRGFYARSYRILGDSSLKNMTVTVPLPDAASHDPKVGIQTDAFTRDEIVRITTTRTCDFTEFNRFDSCSRVHTQLSFS